MLKQKECGKGNRILTGLLIVIFVVNCDKIQERRAAESAGTGLQGTISVSGAFALYPLTVKWSRNFQQEHPQVRINVSAGGAGKGMADALAGSVDLGMFSREIMSAEKDRGVWWVAVARDAVLPTVSTRNPVLRQLKAQGLTRKQFKGIFIDKTITVWGALAGTSNQDPINVYTRSDACGAAGTWARYLGGLQEDLQGIGVYGDPGLADAAKKDPFGIGYNNTIYIYSTKTNQKYPGLEIIPLDLNNNGSLEPDENFYDTMEAVMKAIGTGKYPSPPARELYFVARSKPDQQIVLTFLKWILTKGQNYVSEAGYVPLGAAEINQQLKKLGGKEIGLGS